MYFRLRSSKTVASGGLLLAACGVPGAEDYGSTLQGITIDSNATYRIVGVESNKCVQIEGASTANLARAEIGTCNGSKAQDFRITPVGNAAGFFSIRNVNSGRCLDVEGVSSAEGARLIQWTCSSGRNQQWSISDVSSGVVRLTARHSNKIVEVTAGATADGSDLFQRTWAGQLNQQFRLEVPGSGGAGGQGGSAGASGSGGASAGSAGVAGNGGSAGTGGVCSSTPTSCAAAQVRVTDINFGVNLIGNGNEGDTQAIPLAIAAKPGGGSRIAAMGSDGRVYLGELDCNDKLVGSPVSLPAHDFQDIALDSNGGVVLLTRDAQGGGTLNCGAPTNLCGSPPNPPIACYDMYLVRFNNAGVEQWATKLTSSSASLPPYSTGPTGGQVHMIWWYQHHGRIAYDGANYASYFSEAISVSQNSCINIHEGDRMKVVGPTGALLSGHDSFDWGCSHSWNTRIVWDPAVSRFITVCATDNNNRIARSPGMQTIYSSLDLATLSLGNIVLGTAGGYWISASDQGSVRLLHFTSTNATPDRTVSAVSSPFSHLVSYGVNNMLLAWETGTSMAAQVRNASDGSAIGPQLTVGVADHRYQDFKSFPDGSVAYPARGSTAQSVRIARVLPCSN
jgi:hypothetical protein